MIRRRYKNRRKNLRIHNNLNEPTIVSDNSKLDKINLNFLENKDWFKIESFLNKLLENSLTKINVSYMYHLICEYNSHYLNLYIYDDRIHFYLDDKEIEIYYDNENNIFKKYKDKLNNYYIKYNKNVFDEIFTNIENNFSVLYRKEKIKTLNLNN